MPRNQGTSRKGKPKKNERAAGMGRALQRASQQQRGGGNRKSSTGGMAMTPGTQSINIAPDQDNRGSVLEMNDLDDFLLQAEMANRQFASEKEQLIILDATAQAAGLPVSSSIVVDRPDGARAVTISSGNAPTAPAPDSDSTSAPGASFAFRELSVPRRPKWDAGTTPTELDAREKEAFLDWRRAIARKEEQVVSNARSGYTTIGVTPFEKNLEMWRQLWRVLERCACIVQIVDARNPLFYLSGDLYDYATKELGKPMVLLVNKSDYLTNKQRQEWHDYFQHLAQDQDESSVGKRWNPVFFSAYDEQKELDRQVAIEHERGRETLLNQIGLQSEAGDDDDKAGHIKSSSSDADHGTRTDPRPERGVSDENRNGEGEGEGMVSDIYSSGNVGVDSPLTRGQLLDWLEAFANLHNCPTDKQYNRVPFGMVGFPNVGKSSVINVLMGNASNAHGVVRVGVAAQPGKTKHFQTLLLPGRNNMLLCDCPGLVFPSFVNNTADLIAAGVYPIAHMRDPWPVVDLLCRRIPRKILNAYYGITVPLPSADAMLAAKGKNLGVDSDIPPPTAEEFLTTLCVARGFLAASSGVPDHPRAARMVIGDYAVGRLLYCHAPPHANTARYYAETLMTSLRNTKKLRDKLLKTDTPKPVSTKPSAGYGGDNDVDDDDNDSGESDNDMEQDDLMLELMMGDADVAVTKSKSSKPPRKKRWGKKGRKVRNKDPYGCHITPDEQLLSTGARAAAIGVTVKAGKYTQSGYTRAKGYGGARSV